MLMNQWIPPYYNGESKILNIEYLFKKFDLKKNKRRQVHEQGQIYNQGNMKSYAPNSL